MDFAGWWELLCNAKRLGGSRPNTVTQDGGPQGSSGRMKEKFVRRKLGEGHCIRQYGRWKGGGHLFLFNYDTLFLRFCLRMVLSFPQFPSFPTLPIPFVFCPLLGFGLLRLVRVEGGRGESSRDCNEAGEPEPEEIVHFLFIVVASR